MRYIAKTATGMPATDGAGVKLKRVIGTAALDMLDPFLMLDEFGPAVIAAIEHTGAVMHSVDQVVAGAYLLEHSSRSR